MYMPTLPKNESKDITLPYLWTGLVVSVQITSVWSETSPLGLPENGYSDIGPPVVIATAATQIYIPDIFF